jgi:hypothetical protein
VDSARRGAQRGVVACAGEVLMAATAHASVGLPTDTQKTVPAVAVVMPSVTADAEDAAWFAERAHLAMTRALTPETAPEPAVTPATAPAAPPPPTPAAEPPAASAPTRTISYRPGPSIHTEAVLALVVEHFPADQIGNAMAVSRCESGHSNAIGALNSNGTRDWGVFQLNDGGTLQAALQRIGVAYASTAEAQRLALDAETNIRAARSIYDSRGWAPWVCAHKTGIVAALYTRTPGPMDGRYDERGLIGTVDLARTSPDSGATLPTPTLPTPTKPAVASPTPASKPPSPSPSAAQPPKPAASPTGSPTPSPTGSAAAPSPSQQQPPSPTATPGATQSATGTTEPAPPASATTSAAAPEPTLPTEGQ